MRFLATLLTKLVDNLSNRIHNSRCKGCNCFLEHENVKSNLIKYNCLTCNKNYSEKLNEELKKKERTHLSFPTII